MSTDPNGFSEIVRGQLSDLEEYPKTVRLGLDESQAIGVLAAHKRASFSSLVNQCDPLTCYERFELDEDDDPVAVSAPDEEKEKVDGSVSMVTGKILEVSGEVIGAAELKFNLPSYSQPSDFWGKALAWARTIGKKDKPLFRHTTVEVTIWR